MALRRKLDRMWKGDLHNSAEEIVLAESNTCNSKEPNNMEEVSNIILVRVASDSSALPETIHALADQSLDPVDPAVAQEVDLDLEDFKDEIAAAESERHDSEQPNEVAEVPNILVKVASGASALPDNICDLGEQSLNLDDAAGAEEVKTDSKHSPEENNFDKKKKLGSHGEGQDVSLPSKKKLKMSKSSTLKDFEIPFRQSSDDVLETLSEVEMERKEVKKKEEEEDDYAMKKCHVSIHPLHSAGWQELHPWSNPIMLFKELRTVTKNKLEEEQERMIELERDMEKKDNTISELEEQVASLKEDNEVLYSKLAEDQVLRQEQKETFERKQELQTKEFEEVTLCKEKLEVALVEVKDQKKIAEEKHAEELQNISAKMNILRCQTSYSFY